jgi:hypothetical protein
MFNLLERESRNGFDGEPQRQQPGWPGIDHQEVGELISRIPDGSWKLPDLPFAKYNVKRMVDFMTRAWDGLGYADLLLNWAYKTGEQRAVDSYIYFFKVTPFEGSVDDKLSFITSTLKGMQALVDGGNQRATEEDISKARTFLTSYARFGQKPGRI